MDGYIGGDIYVTSSVNMRTDLWQRLQSVEGVQAVAPVRYFEVKWYTPDGSEEDVPLDQVVSGDKLRIRPGEKVPVDGEITTLG